MAALINIAGAVPIHDPAYRYKMPKLQVKVEGRGNGIKTVLLNVDDLGLALKRDPAEVTKFFGCELGAQTTFTDRAIVNGAHRDADLQQHLCKYIDNFVLCRNCRYPETHYRVKDEIIDQKCLACGHRETVDMTHKLCTFILGNYKRAKDAAKAAEKAEKKKEKKSGEAHANGESDKVKEKKEKKEKKDKKEKKEKKEKKDKKESKDNGLASSSSDDEAPDTVFANMTMKDRARKAVSTPSPMPDTDRNSEDASSDDESPGKNDSDEEESEAQVLESATNEYRSWSAARATATDAERYDHLRALQLTFSLMPQARILIYLGAVYPETFLSDNILGKEQAFLRFLVTPTTETTSSLSLQRQLLAGFEWLCMVKFQHVAALNSAVSISKLCMQLYELELIEEDSFVSWQNDTVLHEYSISAQYGMQYDFAELMKEHAKPFLAWLAEAEDDEEEEEGDEEGN